MKTILLTGLDGSGKSTLLSKISQKFNDVEVILLPHIDISKLKNDEKLKKVAIFINDLSKQADINKVPQLKAIALFSSMLLYKKIFSEIDKIKTIIVERHPLIDTGVYAKFYAEKLFPGSISDEVLNEIDIKFPEEIKYIIELLPKGYQSENNVSSKTIVEFIYNYFYTEKKYGIANLQDLFGVNLPDKIYFLRAKPEILFERIKTRKVLEAHENVEVFRKLDAVYSDIFIELKTKQANLVEEIDANEISNLNKFFDNLNF